MCHFLSSCCDLFSSAIFDLMICTSFHLFVWLPLTICSGFLFKVRSLFSHSLPPYGPDQRDILLFVNTNNSCSLTRCDGVPLRGSQWQPTAEKNSAILSYWTHWSYLFIWITGSTDLHRRAHKTHATVFKTDLWSSGRADSSIWTCIITSRCLSEVASMQEVLLLVFELCCLLRFMGEPVGFLLEDVPHHTVWAWEQTLLVWRHAAYASPCPLNAKRPPQPSTHNPQPRTFPPTPLGVYQRRYHHQSLV